MSVFGNAELFEEFEAENDSAESGSTDDEDSGDSEENLESEKYKELVRENKRLKRALRLLERPSSIKIRDARKDGPVAHVILFNNLLSRKFSEEIQDFFCELCKRKIRDGDEPAIDIQPTFIQYSSTKTEKTKRKKSLKRVEACTKAFQGFRSIQVYDKFYIDHLGQPLYFQEPTFSDWILPQYESVEFGPLSGEMYGIKQGRKKIQRICFNCGGTDHQIKDCEKERDPRAINERRQKFLNEVSKYSQGSPQIRLDAPRYHKDDDGEDDRERFAKFKPGIISTELQKALGMLEDDIPPYIYQMRISGYPPGHLYNARVVKSGLSLYEEGEINGRVQDNEYVPIEVEKIVGFPGFNLPPLPGQQDKYEENGVPPMDHSQSKEVMISYFEHRNALYNNQKAIENQNREIAKEKAKTERDDADIIEIDMEMGEEQADPEILVVEEQQIDYEDSNLGDSNSLQTMEIEADVGDLTQDELEVKRELLLKELKKASEHNQDSDYRNIKSGDQDYRMSNNEMIVATEESPESPPPESLSIATPAVDTDLRVSSIEVDASIESVAIDTPSDIKERSLSSDTDYRVTVPITEPLPSRTADEVPEEMPSEQLGQPTTSCSRDDSGEQRLPGRHKFAKGICQFDMYYSESKQQGVYNKLRTLLKDSPRRQEK